MFVAVAAANSTVSLHNTSTRQAECWKAIAWAASYPCGRHKPKSLVCVEASSRDRSLVERLMKLKDAVFRCEIVCNQAQILGSQSVRYSSSGKRTSTYFFVAVGIKVPWWRWPHFEIMVCTKLRQVATVAGQPVSLLLCEQTIPVKNLPWQLPIPWTSG